MAGRAACGFSILIPRAARLSSAGVFTDVADLARDVRMAESDADFTVLADLAQDVRNGVRENLDDRVDINIDGLPEVELSQKPVQVLLLSRCSGAARTQECRSTRCLMHRQLYLPTVSKALKAKASSMTFHLLPDLQAACLKRVDVPACLRSISGVMCT